MTDEMRTRILRCPSLPTLPSIAIEVVDLAQQSEVDLVQIAQTISQDPALAAKLLRTANSSFYGRSSAVATINQALVVLGLQSVKTLVLGFSLVTTLSSDRTRGFDQMAYWRRSIYAATATRLLAKKIGFVQQEEAFLAALLADIGMIVLSRVLGPQYDAVTRRAADHESLRQVERAALGLDHAETAGILADLWNLPRLLAVPMRHHHSTEMAGEPQLERLAQMVRFGGRCADVYLDPEPAMALRDVRGAMTQHFQLSGAASDALLAELGHKTREAAQLFDINLGQAIDFTSVLKRANETLVELTLQTQRKVAELAEQNEQLKLRASTDRLTGLANRARFDEVLDEQFSIAASARKPLSLVMLDIDKFKSINDRHGHAAGDEVLRHLSQLLKGIARADDLAVRYGGDEMMLVLPGAPRTVAASIAEKLRQAIAAARIACEGVTLHITASLGVATFEPGSGFREPAHLVRAADMALYRAKHAGRNNVKSFASPATDARSPRAA